MNVLESSSPLQSLPFPLYHHLTFSLFPNLVACAAFLAAALTFWLRHRPPATTSFHPNTPEKQPQDEPHVDQNDDDQQTRRNSTSSACSTTSFSFSTPVGGADVGQTRGKFAVYYSESDHEEEEDEEEREKGDVEEYDWVIVKEWGSKPIVTVGLRGGDLGWYVYQDRRVINGSVVRLWDGCSPRRRSSPPPSPVASRRVG